MPDSFSNPTLAGELVSRFEVGYGLAKPLAFGGIWLLSDLLYTITIRRLTAGPTDEVARTTLGRLLGVPTGIARGTIVAMLLLAVVASLPLPEPISQAVQESKLGSRLATRGQSVQRALSGVLGDAVQDSIA